MNDVLQQFLGSVTTGLEGLLRHLTEPAQLAQLVVILIVILATLALRALLGPRVDDWLHNRKNWKRWQLRSAAILRNRIGLIIFALLAWTGAAVLALLEPLSASRAIVVWVAVLATALLLISLLTRLIRNQALRTIAKWAAWIWTTLYLLGFADETSLALEGIAIHLGAFRLSLLAVIKGITISALLFWAARFLARIATARIRAISDMSPSMQVLSVKLMQVMLYGGVIFLGLKAIGFDLTGLAVLSGAIGVGIGFGLQKVVSNLISGIIILMDKSVKPGDVISLGDTFGWINELGARYVSIRTRDGKDYLIPNEDLITGQVVNWSHSSDRARLDIHFGTSYDDDPHKVRALAVKAAAAVPRVVPDPLPVCHITGFGESSVDYVLRFWILDPASGLTNVRGAVFLALWDAFQAEGVSIPFPQRELRLRPTPQREEARPEA